MRASTALAYGIGIATAGINFFYQVIAGTARLVCHQRVVKQAVDQVMATSRYYYNNFFQQSHAQIIARHNQYFSSRRLHEQSDLQNYVLTSAAEMRDYLARLSSPLSSEIPVSSFDVEAALNNDSRCDMIAAIDQFLLWTSLAALVLLCGVRFYASYYERTDRHPPDPVWARRSIAIRVFDETKQYEVEEKNAEDAAEEEVVELLGRMGVNPANYNCGFTRALIRRPFSYSGHSMFFEEESVKDFTVKNNRTPWGTSPPSPLVPSSMRYLLAIVEDIYQKFLNKKREEKHPAVSARISPEPPPQSQLRQRLNAKLG